MAIWRDGTKIVTKFDPKSTKMDQTSIQNRSKIGLGGSWRPCWLQKPSWIRKGRFVGPLLAPKLGPNLGSCWVKNRHKNKFKIKEDFGSDFGASWADFGGHVGAMLRSKTSGQADLRKSLNTLKNQWFLNVFGCCRGSEIEGKSIKNSIKKYMRKKLDF